MQVSVGPGTYVVAVSGGVDSVVLLHLLAQKYSVTAGYAQSDYANKPNLSSTKVKLVVAHFDHEIRTDSAKDKKIVQDMAKQHALPFVHKNGALGAGTSEEKARHARYDFLRHVAAASKARGIITAHHQDDVVETAIINLMRGTGRRGMSSLQSSESLVRPLLGYTKSQLIEYAQNHALPWREDTTNQDVMFTRNYVRHKILPNFSEGHRAQLLILLDGLRDINHELDGHLINLLHTQPALDVLDRQWFIGLPHDISKEVVHAWLNRQAINNLSKRTIDRLVVAMKTGHSGQRIDVDKKLLLLIRKDSLALAAR